MNKYILLDNPYFLDYFCKSLSNKYIPIAINDELRALLEAKGIKSLCILDYLGFGEVKDVIDRAFFAADYLMADLDMENRTNYREIFGTGDIKLIQATISYLFKRFAVGSLKLVRGMEAISKNHKIEEIAYLHDGEKKILCGTKKKRGFFFPDDITWNVLENWKYPDKPKINFIKAPKRSWRYPMKRNLKERYVDCLMGIKRLLFPKKQRLLLANKEKRQVYSSDGKTLLFLSPL